VILLLVTDLVYPEKPLGFTAIAFGESWPDKPVAADYDAEDGALI